MRCWVSPVLTAHPRSPACRSANGTALFMSSIDGYCSVVVFGPEELGERLLAEELPPTLRREHAATFPDAAKVGAKRKAGSIAAAGGAGDEAATAAAQAASPTASAAPADSIDAMTCSSAPASAASGAAAAVNTLPVKRRIAPSTVPGTQTTQAAESGAVAAASLDLAPSPATVAVQAMNASATLSSPQRVGAAASASPARRVKPILLQATGAVAGSAGAAAELDAGPSPLKKPRHPTTADDE